MTTQAMLQKEIDALRERVVGLEHQLALQEQTLLALQENEARLQSVLNNLLDAPYRRNLRTDCYDYLSPVIEQLTGWTVEEMNQAATETVLARIHPDDLPQVQQEIERTNRLCGKVGRAMGVLEYRFRTKAGDYCWLDDHMTVIAGDDGQPLYRLGVVRDITERIWAEEAQQESLAKLERLFEILPVGISVLNHQRQVVKQNPALENIIGISAEGLTRGDYRQRQYIRSDGTVMPREEFASARVIRGEPSALNVETGIIKEDGSVTWTNVSAVTVPFSDWSAVIVTQDITAKKQAEQALQASEQNLTALIENTDASIWSVDAQYRMIVGNELYHRNVSAAIGRSLAPGESVLSLNLPPAALDEWRSYYDRALEGETFSVEASTRFAAETRTIEYRFNPIRTSEGQISGVTVFGRDITERKRAEEALMASEERFRTLFETSRDGIVTVDMQGYIQQANPAYQTMLGYTMAELRALTYRQLTPARWYEAEEYLVQTMILTYGDSGEYEKEYIRKDGTVFPISLRTWTVYDTTGQLLGMRAFVRDITERKQAEEALRRAKDELEDRVQERTRELSEANAELQAEITARKQTEAQLRQVASQLTLAEQAERHRVGQILHDDLQQLLYGIQLRLEFINQGLETDQRERLRAEAQRAIHWMEEVVTKMRQLTVDLSPPVLSHEGLTAALGWLVAQMRELHGLQVKVEAEQGFPIADEGMRVLLFQIVRELLFNVVKHAQTDQARVVLCEEVGYLVIQVSDEGRGFAVEMGEVESRPGLGLRRMRERLSLFGGQMKLVSQPGKGCQVTISLPLTSNQRLESE